MEAASEAGTILLRPRPYARLSGALLLLPLLPQPTPLKPLPGEIWTEIFRCALQSDPQDIGETTRTLLTVCKAFKDTVLPLVYSRVTISHVSALERFYTRLHQADQKWDSIRRIPYSTPGRWVQALDLSTLMFTGQSQALQLDSLLTALFPLVPFLSRLSMNPAFVLSRRAVRSLADREGARNLRVLDGLSYVPTSPLTPVRDDHLVALLKCCPNLEELEVIGHGPDPAELDLLSDGLWSLQVEADVLQPDEPLSLPRLHTLTLLSMFTSPVMTHLLHSPLPSLRKLTVTPYADLPYPASLVSQFIQVHGPGLRSLHMYTPKSWPTRLHPAPDTLLQTSPHLRHLTLENPVPYLILTAEHPLRILAFPRPTPECWQMLEKLSPQLPRLQIVRIRDVRWLRKGMTSRAQEAGVQGEMKEWKRRLARKRIRIVDADWNDQD
ncbi:hypothetical protein BDN72DRAFT_46323 [Pluteus cervinus]|uniref:Uncharacterized protein n=1 Tax=Pluteus cervinus TaxID=181527 RepID=A0ACD3BID7_9AGAR|nr:hypothetical protein BDN72DRAFT_46323 [Pluteus cervinus]